jgi:hypothetical protein
VVCGGLRGFFIGRPGLIVAYGSVQLATAQVKTWILFSFIFVR